jgi:hypothetical protein
VIAALAVIFGIPSSAVVSAASSRDEEEDGDRFMVVGFAEFVPVDLWP